jgi:bifunctional UDP-N-acetylglucosamine pyrophosphorylase / glucosamine-1-phosphate N-acetyltransferase
MTEIAAIILAAGISKRMNTRIPKVLHEVCGMPMLAYVLDACKAAGIKKMYVVVGFAAEQVQERFADADEIVWVKQENQLGTAHAVLCCREYLQNFRGQILILCGDGPLIRTETLKTLIEKHNTEQPAATMATALLDNPAGYGRIDRDQCGNLRGIIEDCDCTKEQSAIKEINPSYYMFDSKILWEALGNVKADNAKKEYYLTDAIAHAISTGRKVLAVTALKPEEAMSINSREQLGTINRIMQQRIQQQLMKEGVTIVAPENTWINAGAKIGQDTIIEPFTYIHSNVTISKNCRIGPFVDLIDGTTVKADTLLSVSNFETMEKRK